MNANAELWIDTDMGFDDFWAIQMLAAQANIAGMSLTFGNSPLKSVETNAARASAFAGWSWPIHSGAAQSILGDVITAGHVLGPTGITSRGKQFPTTAPLKANLSAHQALVAWLEVISGPATILALGPLTNIAIVALARPDLMLRIESLIWMGGSAGPGNQTASAEFNAFADPEALAIVLQSDLPLRMIDLEICRKILIYPDDLAPLQARQDERAAILADLLGGYIDIALERGRPAMALYDPTAAAALLHPKAFEFKAISLDVELAGQKTRGRTIVDARRGRPVNAEIASFVDAETIRQIALAALL